MLTRACVDFARAISSASRTATTISARSSSSSCESGSCGESSCASTAAGYKLAARGACRAGTSRCGHFTSRPGRDDQRYVKPCTGRRSESFADRSEEHTSELQSHSDLVCRLLLEKKKHHIRQFGHDTSSGISTA